MGFIERNFLGPLEVCGGHQKVDRHLGHVRELLIHTPTPASEEASPSLQLVCLEELQARLRYWPSALLLKRELTGTSYQGAVEAAQGGQGQTRAVKSCRQLFGRLDGRLW